VGHDFNADYVINLEIDKLSLYEPNSKQQFYRGHTEILVSLIDMKNPDDVQNKEFSDDYPTEAGDMTIWDMSPTAFRDRFVGHFAKRLSFYFVDHPKQARIAASDD
jgi:hypothetical protein